MLVECQIMFPIYAVFMNCQKIKATEVRYTLVIFITITQYAEASIEYLEQLLAYKMK